ncbi:hypothetical protein SAMN05660489_05575 [Pseudomonas sp. LAMO17WK12:I10]|nr:hypothetical protein H160_05569 [Pseudomonas sp. LAMO17WK12:I9]SNY50915.1 hypothetical protein SAMN05660489_05575 [Pseudomonas sp. LAMO17WK12:I10]
MAERSAHVPGEGNMFYLIHNTRTVGDALLELATLPLVLSQPIDNQPDNVTQYQMVCDSLSRYFNVSKTAIRLRMRALGLLVEVGWPG